MESFSFFTTSMVLFGDDSLALKGEGRRKFLVLCAVSLGVILEVYPYLLNRVPYGTDEWGLIRNAQQLLKFTPTTLGSNPVFDGYNIYWPGASLFGAAGSLILGSSPIEIMPLAIPIIGALTTFVFFLIAEKISKSTNVAFVASLIFTSAIFFSISQASATKETYASLLFMTIILLLLTKIPISKKIGLYTLLVISLALTHEATTFILIAIILALAATHFVLFLSERDSEFTIYLSLLAILAAVSGLYFEFYADVGWSTLKIGVNISQVALLGSLLVLATVFVANYALSRTVKNYPIALIGGLTMSAVGIALAFSIFIPVVTLSPIIPPAYIQYAIPYLFVGIFAVLGYNILISQKRDHPFTFCASWLAAILALCGFVILGTGGIEFLFRLFTFLYAPAAILAAIALGQLATSLSKERRFLVALAVLLVVALGCYQSYAAVVGGDNLLGAHWTYTYSDFTGSEYISTYAPRNYSITSDLKMDAILTGYFNLKVPVPNVLEGYQYLLSPSSHASPQLLVTYAMMNRDGYVLVAYGFPLPNDWMQNVSQKLSLVYSNGNIMGWE